MFRLNSRETYFSTVFSPLRKKDKKKDFLKHCDNIFGDNFDPNAAKIFSSAVTAVAEEKEENRQQWKQFQSRKKKKEFWE